MADSPTVERTESVLTRDKSSNRRTFRPSVLKVSLLVLLRRDSSYVLLTPPTYGAANSCLTRGKLIQRRSFRTRRNDVIYEVGHTRSAPYGRREGLRGERDDPGSHGSGMERFKSIRIDTHFSGDYRPGPLYGVTL